MIANSALSIFSPTGRDAAEDDRVNGSVTEKAYNRAPIYVLTDVGTAR